MGINLSRPAVVVIVACVLSIVAMGLAGGHTAARPQYDWGVSCMYTDHLIPGATGADWAYVDPGDGFDEVHGTWTAEFRHRYTGTSTWTTWTRVDQFGDVDSLATCTNPSLNTRIWAFTSSAVRLDVFDKSEWRVHIDDEYDGNECDDNSSAPVADEVDETGEAALWETACASRDIGTETDEYVVVVAHE